jgi:hypothetical protein
MDVNGELRRMQGAESGEHFLNAQGIGLNFHEICRD